MMKIHLKKNNKHTNLCGAGNRTVAVSKLEEFKALPKDRMCKRCAAAVGIYL